MNTLTQEIVSRLEAGENLVLASIITRNGSAPRSAGAQMVIMADGSISGTIGGGLLEAQSIKLAMGVFSNHAAIVKEFHLTGKDAAASDMICGGNQEVLLEFMDSEDKDLLAAFRAALHQESTRQKGWWILQVPNPGETIIKIPRWFIAADGKVSSRIGLSITTNIMLKSGESDPTASTPDEPGILLELDKVINQMILPREPQVQTIGNGRFYIDPLSNYGTVYIFGAGHVSQKLAILTNLVGFRTVVLDDRADFANKQRFPSSDEIIVIKNNETAFSDLQLDPESYLVIVTRGHLHDKVILAQALTTKAVYIGMIGSKRKREEIYTALKSEGVKQETLDAVHSPIGLTIGAESPEEIAVSITAELILAREKHHKAARSQK